jgi:hypothetical protein
VTNEHSRIYRRAVGLYDFRHFVLRCFYFAKRAPQVIYDRLRSIGVSVETADALAPILETLPERKQEAFILWAMGCNWKFISRDCKMSERDIALLLKSIKKMVVK